MGEIIFAENIIALVSIVFNKNPSPSFGTAAPAEDREG